jgi:hypothetical protein
MGPLAEPILVALKACLKPHGYSKSGSTFRLRSSETVSIISLQSSTSSTAVLAKVTVNLGVHILALQDPERSEKNPSVWSTHWNHRIGHLMPENNDVWWSIHNTAEAVSVATEIARCVEQYGLPALAQVATVQALRQLWESGRSPGLTEGQRIRHLQELAELEAS